MCLLSSPGRSWQLQVSCAADCLRSCAGKQRKAASHWSRVSSACTSHQPPTAITTLGSRPAPFLLTTAACPAPCPYVQHLHSRQAAKPGPGFPHRRKWKRAGSGPAICVPESCAARLPGTSGVRSLLVSEAALLLPLHPSVLRAVHALPVSRLCLLPCPMPAGLCDCPLPDDGN